MFWKHQSIFSLFLYALWFIIHIFISICWIWHSKSSPKDVKTKVFNCLYIWRFRMRCLDLNVISWFRFSFFLLPCLCLFRWLNVRTKWLRSSDALSHCNAQESKYSFGWGPSSAKFSFTIFFHAYLCIINVFQKTCFVMQTSRWMVYSDDDYTRYGFWH